MIRLDHNSYTETAPVEATGDDLPASDRMADDMRRFAATW